MSVSRQSITLLLTTKWNQNTYIRNTKDKQKNSTS